MLDWEAATQSLTCLQPKSTKAFYKSQVVSSLTLGLLACLSCHFSRLFLGVYLLNCCVSVQETTVARSNGALIEQAIGFSLALHVTCSWSCCATMTANKIVRKYGREMYESGFSDLFWRLCLEPEPFSEPNLHRLQ